jgi:ferric-dicitrate binding protein FerR (iron transport regulator)
MENEYRSPEALAADPSFIDWVQHPTPANTAVWERWLAQYPDQKANLQLARQLVTVWQLAPIDPPAGAQANVWAAIQEQKNEPQIPYSVRERRPTPAPRRRIGTLAMVFGTLLLLAGAVLYRLNTGLVEYGNMADAPRTVTLPDGSTVVLNAGASVRLARHWPTDEPRTVWLTGKAQFSVTHQSTNQRFVVQTPDRLQVEVLGTVFTVDEQNRQTRVVLNSGRVQLHVASQSTPINMVPGELVDVPVNTRHAIVRRRVEPAMYSAWTTQQFIFDNTSLGEIADLLAQDLGYRTEFADPALRDRRMTIHLPTRDPDILLAAIAEANDLTVSTVTTKHIRIASVEHSP